MVNTKAGLYNLALSALLLSRKVIDVETDKSTEVEVLNTHYDIALESTLKDLNLDTLAAPIVLELIEETDNGSPWVYAYKYPVNCAFFRRLASGAVTDNRYTHISKAVGMYKGQKAIFTNEYQAIGECIAKDVPLVAFSSMAFMALAYRLAYLSAPLAVGKGAKSLMEGLQASYLIAKIEAQEDDQQENANYEADDLRSEFVASRVE